jgi:hypothetical protein
MKQVRAGTMSWVLVGAGCVALTFLIATASAEEKVVVRRDGKEHSVAGRLEIKAADGGLLLMARDGVLWNIQPAEQVSHTSDKAEFKPFDREQITKDLLAELPPGFEVHSTTHYLICHNTSKAYAQWCGALFERLYLAFTNYWKRQHFNLREPEFPLVAIVFGDEQQYFAHAEKEVGAAAKSIIGYYNLQTNRMTMYDLTGTAGVRQPGDRRSNAAQINQLLSRPEAERTVATIIHEATHQIAYNCGFHTRLSDVPLWVNEGLANYFETPDLSRGKGWRTIGAVNPFRLAGFRDYAPRRTERSLESLILDDSRFRDPRQAADAYAEAWALNYYLLQKHSKAYHAYLAAMSKKRPMVWDTPEERLKEFKLAFGLDLKEFDADFVRYMQRVK